VNLLWRWWLIFVFTMLFGLLHNNSWADFMLLLQVWCSLSIPT
jgi:hypothetical protein